MIRVTDDYVVDVDQMGYTVCKDEHRKVYQKNVDRWVPYFKSVAYYSKFPMALAYIAERIAKDQLSAPIEYTLEEAIITYKQSFEMIENAVRNIVPEEIQLPTKKAKSEDAAYVEEDEE